MPYAAALALTLLVELPIYGCALVAAGLARPRGALLGAVAVNLATHPLAWLAIGHLSRAYPDWAFGGVELLVWWVEAGLWWLWIRRDAGLLLLVALVANTASALAGVGASLWWS